MGLTTFSQMWQALFGTAKTEVTDGQVRWITRTFGLFIFKDFIYLFIRERGRDIGRGRSRPRGWGVVGESDAGLDPRTPASRPEPEADTQPLSRPGALNLWFRLKNSLS